MSVKIRLKRVGKKKAPSYRVVVADSRSPRDGRIIENGTHSELLARNGSYRAGWDAQMKLGPVVP